MNIHINTSHEQLTTNTKSIPEIRPFLLYACHNDSYFVVMLGNETKAIYMFTDIELLISFIEINTSFNSANIEAFDEAIQAVEYIHSLTV